MTSKNSLRLCNVLLLLLAAPVLLSSVHLEVTSCASARWVWVHTVLGALFFALVLWHLRLHCRWGRMRTLLFRGPNPTRKWLSILGLLCLSTALVAVLFRLSHDSHSHIGGIHGKVGFLLLLCALLHAFKRRLGYMIRNGIFAL